MYTHAMRHNHSLFPSLSGSMSHSCRRAVSIHAEEEPWPQQQRPSSDWRQHAVSKRRPGFKRRAKEASTTPGPSTVPRLTRPNDRRESHIQCREGLEAATRLSTVQVEQARAASLENTKGRQREKRSVGVTLSRMILLQQDVGGWH